MDIKNFNILKPFDQVWLMQDNEPKRVSIHHVIFTQSKSNPVEVYVYSCKIFSIKNEEVFNTKYELLLHVFGELKLHLKEPT